MPSLTRALDRVIFYGLLLTIVLTAVPYGTVQPWSIALFECLVLFLGLLAILDLLLTKAPLPAGGSLALPGLALCLFILLQALPVFRASRNALLPPVWLSISADPFSSLLLAVKLFVLIVAGVLLLRYANSASRLRAVIYVVVGVAVLSALFGVLRQGLQTGSTWLLLPNDGRGFAQFVNRNHFGFLMEMALGLTLGLMVQRGRGYQRFTVLLPIAAFLWVSLILSNSRGGIFASLCQVLFLGLLLKPFRVSSRDPEATGSKLRSLIGDFALKGILAALMVVVFVYGVSWIGGETVITNFEQSAYSFSEQGQANNVSRKHIWSTTWQLIKSHPIAGIGFAGYWIAVTKYHQASGAFTPQEAHNDYLELLASGGLIGAGLVLWFAFLFIRKARQGLRSRSRFHQAAALGALTGIFGVMIHSFVDFGLHVTANALIFTMLIVIATREGLVHELDAANDADEFELDYEPNFITY